MVDDDKRRQSREPENIGSRWSSYLGPAVSSLLVLVIYGIISTYGSNIVSNDKNIGIAQTQVDGLRESTRSLDSKLDAVSDKLNHLSEVLGSLYTRAEARDDRADTQRRFESIEQRLDRLESSMYGNRLPLNPLNDKPPHP